MASRFWLVVAGSLLWVACEGDSSSTINVYGSGTPVSDGGSITTGGWPATGGRLATGGLIATGGRLATGGMFATGGRLATGGMIATGGTISIVSVPGGVRDTQSTQCLASTDGCPVGAAYLSCMNAFCAKPLATCYTVSTSGTVLGGTCASYAKCQMACPCDKTRGTCETQCYLNYVQPDPACSTCMYTVLSCASKNDCGSPVSCGTGGAVASVGGTPSGVGAAMAVGGSISGAGGTISRTGGIVPGTGGAIPRTGGNITGAGGGMATTPDASLLPPGVGPYCAQAARCCQTLPIAVGSVTDICNVVGSALETTCVQITANLQAAGFCKTIGLF